MYTEKQLERMYGKLKRLEAMLEPKLFITVDAVPMKAFQTDGSHHDVPESDCFMPCEDGTVFEGEGIYCWFRGTYVVPEELAGKTLFVYPKIRGYEGMLWVDGKPYGNFASKRIVNSHGNHYCDMLRQEVQAGETIDIAFEYYANHYIKGTQPFLVEAQRFFRIEYHPVDICLRDEEIAAFYFDLRIANQMMQALEPKSFRRAAFARALLEIHSFISYDFENEEPEIFREQIRRADAILKKVLKEKNASSAPYAGLIGHSHMDTAWLWHRGETEKKCARTYANQMNLMDQYPDYTFIQSSAYHGDIIKRMYPALFEDIKKRVAEGRYEPNGGVWIECDCNIPSGEYMIRQFLWGQRFTRENFDFTSDAFWLPDTFGYSASLPQIMQGCGVKYFLTTKMSWNDTNVFPYDSFYWKGIDGSKVLVHFNRTHVWPDPLTFRENLLETGDNTIKERAVSDMRLISYGFGDGGGGPEFGMIEMAERLKDVEGMPRTSHTTVSRFMQELEKNLTDPSVYNGELYLELHRGTLTNQHVIKRNNRKAEFALRDLEYITVRDAVSRGEEASGEQIAPLMNEMLVNQFHDILPGTCIPRAHDEAISAVSHIIETAKGMTVKLMEAQAKETETKSVTAVNTLSFARSDVLYLPFEGQYVSGCRQQVVKDMDGRQKLAVMGVTIPAFGSTVLSMTDEYTEEESVFSLYREESGKEVLETPVVTVTFNEKGYLESFVDKRNGRQLRGEGYALNTFLMAEEVSLGWDNWDVDADYECKLRDSAQLLSREVAADGPVEFRIRSRYRLSAKS
ncbi:MAG: alpha-mannosidase, partial [Lachnospiraceae bacterium]|nr:alpha-mannosidase [Lachnospiraceae bacterium]